MAPDDEELGFDFSEDETVDVDGQSGEFYWGGLTPETFEGWAKEFEEIWLSFGQAFNNCFKRSGTHDYSDCKSKGGLFLESLNKLEQYVADNEKIIEEDLSNINLLQPDQQRNLRAMYELYKVSKIVLGYFRKLLRGKFTVWIEPGIRYGNEVSTLLNNLDENYGVGICATLDGLFDQFDLFMTEMKNPARPPFLKEVKQYHTVGYTVNEALRKTLEVFNKYLDSSKFDTLNDCVWSDNDIEGGRVMLDYYFTNVLKVLDGYTAKMDYQYDRYYSDFIKYSKEALEFVQANKAKFAEEVHNPALLDIGDRMFNMIIHFYQLFNDWAEMLKGAKDGSDKCPHPVLHYSSRVKEVMSKYGLGPDQTSICTSYEQAAKKMANKIRDVRGEYMDSVGRVLLKAAGQYGMDDA